MKARLLLPLSPLLIAAASWAKAPTLARSWEFVAVFGVTCTLAMIGTEIALRIATELRKRTAAN